VRSGDADAVRMATVTLERMARGGIYDRSAAAFIATPRSRLLVPTSKMLYDNALLAVAYLEGFVVTRRADFAAVARDVLDYVAREMTGAGGVLFGNRCDSETPDGRR